MNRTFIADLTPARARMLLLMHRHADFELDERVIECAHTDRIDRSRLVDLGIVDDSEQEAVQFIHDTNFRAGIPVPTNQRLRATAIVDAAITLAGLAEDEIVYVDGSSRMRATRFDEITEFDFESLLPLRKKLVVMNLDQLDVNASHGLLGKMFPRIICMGSMLVQYSFAFGGKNSTTTRMGQVLYPAVEDSIRKTTWKQNERQSILAMGVYPDFLEEFHQSPKKMSKSFIIERSNQY